MSTAPNQPTKIKSNSDSGKSYHTACTGDALVTAQAHGNLKDEDITLFGSCFCPFVQRVWVGFEVLGIPYRYYEVDPYKKPKELLEVSPKGLVPALRFERFSPPRSLNESTVILDYLEDLAATTTKRSLLPPITNPYARGLARLQADHVNRSLVPAFYRYLQAQDPEKQIEAGKEFHASVEGLVKLLERAEGEVLGVRSGGAGEGGGAGTVGSSGVTGEGELRMLRKGLGVWVESEGEGELGWVDVMAGPWLYRAKVVLTHYRGFQLPQGERFNGWLNRLFEHPQFKKTCSTDQLYLDSYERYAFNRPNTSQVAKAINEGRALP